MTPRTLLTVGLLAAGFSQGGAAFAQSTVHCKSRQYQYDECFAGPLTRPQLIHQVSNASCILNKTWGYNPQTRYIWVAQGCEGVFADVGGYHHGRGGQADANARAYDERGHDTGAAIGGAILGALLEGAVENHHHHATSNVSDDDGGYNGCHGVGCLVDTPDDSSDDIDPTPQFDKDGNPNFDTEGNYQGCHGMGCLVDNPDDSGSDSDG